MASDQSPVNIELLTGHKQEALKGEELKEYEESCEDVEIIEPEEEEEIEMSQGLLNSIIGE